jgi:hypothetical protein
VDDSVIPASRSPRCAAEETQRQDTPRLTEQAGIKPGLAIPRYTGGPMKRWLLNSWLARVMAAVGVRIRKAQIDQVFADLDNSRV